MKKRNLRLSCLDKVLELAMDVENVHEQYFFKGLNFYSDANDAGHWGTFGHDWTECADQLMESHFLSYGIMRTELDLSEQQLEEAMQRLTDYANHIPLWHLRGFTATDYPSEAYVPMRKAKMKGHLGKELKKMKQEMRPQMSGLTRR